MPYKIIRNDITRFPVDAIVNTASIEPVIGSGTDFRINEVAGPELIAARKRIGTISLGDVSATPGFNLPAKYCFHGVCPSYSGDLNLAIKNLRSVYSKCLNLAVALKCKSISFPLLSSGNLGFPKKTALDIAISEFEKFLLNKELNIYLVIFDKNTVLVADELLIDITHYIEDRYEQEYYDCCNMAFMTSCCDNFRGMKPKAKKVLKPGLSIANIQDLLDETDASFSDTLFKIIDEKGYIDTEVYKRANIDRRLFNKIKNNSDYRPSKSTAVALSIALGLSFDEMTDLLNRAGIALTHSNKFDIIIEYFVKNKNYNLIEINEILYQFDQPLIGM